MSYFNINEDDSQFYTASYVKDEASKAETPLVVSRRLHNDNVPGRKSVLHCSLVQTEKASMMRYWHTLGTYIS